MSDAWPGGLTSPTTGRPLAFDTPHSLAAGGERWLVLDGIPYLRAGSEALAAEALGLMDAGRADEAAACLLAENDPWWDEAPPPRADLIAVVRERDRLSLREAMARLGWGRVGDYFAHRWSDPTYLATLGLLEAHWREPASAFEIACGIGHSLRALSRAGVGDVAGGDIVFGKLWVCRHWVCPEARLICFDAERERWPMEIAADLVTCPDAFYFLQNKEAVARRIREGARSVYAVPHVHNAQVQTFSSGAAATAAALSEMFSDAVMYDDAELTRAAAAGRSPTPGAVDGAEAISLVGGPGLAAPQAAVRPPALVCPKQGTPLARNPALAGAGRIVWPSDRYRDEYGPIVTYGRSDAVPERAVMSDAVAPLVRTRDLLDLPARW